MPKAIPLNVTTTAANVNEVTKALEVSCEHPARGRQAGTKTRSVPSTSKATAAMTRNRFAWYCVGSVSRPSLPDATQSTAVDWVSNAGS